MAEAKKIEIRAVICIWCGEAITYPTEASKKVVYEAMKEHDLTCADHPLQKLIADQTAVIEKLKKLLGDCLRNMDRWPRLHEGMNKLTVLIRQALDAGKEKQ